MASIKIHLVIGDTEDDGTESCDFRGLEDGALGETHRTLFEKDFGPDVETNAEIEQVLADGPAWNRGTAGLMEMGLVAGGVLGDVLGAVGGTVRLRVGVWDK